VPAQFKTLGFNVIDGTLCLFVFPGVGITNNLTGKLLDASNVVSQCHDILPYFAGLDDAVGPSSKTDAFECV